MKEHSILFSTESIAAILKNKKTQTRRIFELQCLVNPQRDYSEMPSPYGNIGDRIWVRETFAFINNSEFGEKSYYEYKADRPEAKYPGDWPSDLPPDEVPCKWKSPLFMPRLASRIILEITDLRIERLNAISEDDCIKEGIQWINNGCCEDCFQWTFNKKDWYDYAPDCYSDVWNKLLGKKYPWKNNPWVWVINFKRIK